MSEQSWILYSVLVVKTNQLLFIVILNTPRSARIAAERRHGVVRSFRVCTVKRDWLPQAIVLSNFVL